MLDQIDVNKTVDKETYRAARENLGAELGKLQRELKEEKIPVMIVFDGLDAAGKGLQINRMIQALDPRGYEVYAAREATEDEVMRPFLWRYWTKTPEAGKIAIYDRSWYHRVTVERFEDEPDERELAEAFKDINSFERQLTDGGAVIIKFFLLISKKEQKKRFKKLKDSRETRWRVSAGDEARNEHYGRYLAYNEEMLEKTDTDFAPWTIVEAEDKDYAALKILIETVRQFKEALEAKRAAAGKKTAEITELAPLKNGVLSGVDLAKTMDRETYKKEMDRLKKRLEFLHSEIYRLRIPVVLCFEGWDAAGKGGAIRRLTSHLDPRGYKVVPTASPNDLEKAHHYLWRFWNQMPKAGHIAIFDRTWYGRVMVERIEGFCTGEEWRRAYGEINEMEAHMANFGAVILKFWIHIDKEEQLKRFNERQENPEKQWKITDEDWRNREKWDAYETAVDEMLVRTSTTYAPWIVVEGNSKYYARVKILSAVADALETRIKSCN